MEVQVTFKSDRSNEVPVVMTIAGSDASGGAGIQVRANGMYLEPRQLTSIFIS